MARHALPALLFIGTLTGGCMLADSEQIDSERGKASALTAGNPEAIELEATGRWIDTVIVEVKKGWVNSDSFALDIAITGLNGEPDTPVSHGEDVVPLSATTVFGTEKDQADVAVAWSEDDFNRRAGETYTVCVQVLVPSGPLGPEICQDFPTGPLPP